MQVPSRTRFGTAILATLLLGMTCISPGATADPGGQNPVARTPSAGSGEARRQALMDDVKDIARSGKVTPEQAARHLNDEDLLSSLASELKATYADRWAGLYITHSPETHLVVRLKASAQAAIDASKSLPDDAPVTVTGGASHTLQELQDVIHRQYPELKQAFPELQGIYVDQRTGEVVLDVYGSPSQARPLHDIAQQMVEAPVRVDMHSSRLVLQIGS